MHSFLFPEDLDSHTVRRVDTQSQKPEEAQLPRSRKTSDAARRRRPVPIILPPTFDYNKIEVKAKDEVVVSVTRFSLDERSPTFEKLKEKRPSALSRWKSATLSKQDKEDRQVRMALAESERAAHAAARLDTGHKIARGLHPQLSPLTEERDGRHSPMDYGVHVMF